MFEFLFSRLSTISRFRVAPSDMAMPRSGLCAATMVLNENDNIEEWLEFHKLAGVNYFIIYDNGCSDGTQETIKRVLNENEGQIIPWKQTFVDGRLGISLHTQASAMAHAIMNFRERFRWMVFFDVDEFIVPKFDIGITDALDRLNHLSNISLPWHMFGSNGHKDRPAAGMVQSYTSREDVKDTGMRQFKCIFDPIEVKSVRVHSVTTRSDGKMTSNDTGLVMANSSRSSMEFYSNKFLQLNHYFTKSEGEFLSKLKKGHVTQAHSDRYRKKILGLYDEVNSGAVFDDCAALFLARRNS